jgi:hypothetical protein
MVSYKERILSLRMLTDAAVFTQLQRDPKLAGREAAKSANQIRFYCDETRWVPISDTDQRYEMLSIASAHS